VSKNPTKYLFVTGGVLSGVGKGITAASIGNILKSRGLKVNIQKCDPYLNVDSGTLNPAEHGECFVTKDGAETDLDLGHYERFLDIELTKSSSLMSGRVFQKVIEDERAGRYLGHTVQIVPHFTQAIQDYIEAASKGFDVHIVEIGGTVGDYEGLAFIEAIREFAARAGRQNCLYIHVVYLPYLGASKEIKSKPAQNATRDLRSFGITPDILIARSEMPAPQALVDKLSMFTGVEKAAIALLPNAPTVYQVPLSLEEQGIGDYVSRRLGHLDALADNNDWEKLVERVLHKPAQTVRVGMVAKYLDNEDSYMSVVEALKSACYALDVGLDLQWLNAEDFNDQDPAELLKGVDGIVVPGGFGIRGIEGKIAAARYAMNNDLPYLGLCLGMQVAVSAFARENGLDGANTTECDPKTSYPVIDIMAEQKMITDKGGTMRLGNYPCVLKPHSLARLLYGKPKIQERHRHRYEFNNNFREQLEKAGLVCSGVYEDKDLVEIIELTEHRFFIASQFHPEFTSRPARAHPMFRGFIAALKNSES
jgi:CTP synthase